MISRYLPTIRNNVAQSRSKKRGYYMKTFYHATPKDNLFKIMKEGIKADFMGYVYLCEKPVDCMKFMKRYGKGEYAVIPLELDENDVMISTDHDEAYYGCKAYTYSGNIEPDAIPHKLDDILLYSLK